MQHDALYWSTHFNWRLLIVATMGFGAAAVLRSLLDNPRQLPRVRTWLLGLWVPAVLGFGTSAVFGYVNKWFPLLYTLFVLGVGAAVLLRLRRYRPAATALWGLVPLMLHFGITVVLRARELQFVQPYRDYFRTWSNFNLLWLAGMLVLAFVQKKNLRNEQARLAEAERQRQLVAARNAELERLVAERTAALTQQADALQAALRELRATQQQLIQSEKMASLGELTAGIAHEIQNPLNFVNNFADVSQELVAELETEHAHPTPRCWPRSRAAERPAPQPAQNQPARPAGGQHCERHAAAQPRQYRRAPAHRPQCLGRRVLTPGLPRPARPR